jgi:hypothetical protein
VCRIQRIAASPTAASSDYLSVRWSPSAAHPALLALHRASGVDLIDLDQVQSATGAVPPPLWLITAHWCCV